MSVIFNSLRKMQERSSLKDGNRKILRPKPKKYFFNKTLFSPKFVIILSACIFLTGFATLYGVNVLKTQIGQKAETPDMKTQTHTSQTEPAYGKIKKDIVDQVSPQMPAPPKQDSTNSQNFARYLPPDPDILPEPSAEPGLKNDSKTSPQHRKNTDANAPDLLSSEKKTELSDRPQHEEPQYEDRIADPDPDAKHNNTAMDTTIGKKDSMVTQTPPLMNPKETKANEMNEKDSKEDLFADSAQKSSDISKLVIQLQRAMQTNNPVRVNEIVTKLAGLKGVENNYVLKIKAFWCIQKGDYETAGATLEKVLEKDESDLEAGINLAVVEIKTSKFNKARIRLMKLQEIYPYNTQIPELIQKLSF